jgi:pimeloyl-ACP methyl ester carboxylesterase
VSVNTLMFVHGGPGLSSQPERLLLGPLLARQQLPAVFWDEPSRLRPGLPPFNPLRAYDHWLESLRRSIINYRPKILIGLSFGALGLIDALNEGHPEELQQVLMIAPTLDMNRVFKTMMSFCIQDYMSSDTPSAEQLKSYRDQTRGFWDTAMQMGVDLVWANPKLLTHYFADPEFLQQWAGTLNSEFQIDFESQKAVLNDLAQRQTRQPKAKPLNLELTVWYGKSDPVFDRAEIEQLVRPRFRSVQFVEAENCGHFPHIEKSAEFVALLQKLIGAHPTP